MEGSQSYNVLTTPLSNSTAQVAYKNALNQLNVKNKFTFQHSSSPVTGNQGQDTF